MASNIPRGKQSRLPTTSNRVSRIPTSVNRNRRSNSVDRLEVPGGKRRATEGPSRQSRCSSVEAINRIGLTPQRGSCVANTPLTSANKYSMDFPSGRMTMSSGHRSSSIGASKFKDLNMAELRTRYIDKISTFCKNHGYQIDSKALRFPSEELVAKLFYFLYKFLDVNATPLKSTGYSQYIKKELSKAVIRLSYPCQISSRVFEATTIKTSWPQVLQFLNYMAELIIKNKESEVWLTDASSETGEEELCYFSCAYDKFLAKEETCEDSPEVEQLRVWEKERCGNIDENDIRNKEVQLDSLRKELEYYSRSHAQTVELEMKYQRLKEDTNNLNAYRSKIESTLESSYKELENLQQQLQDNKQFIETQQTKLNTLQEEIARQTVKLQDVKQRKEQIQAYKHEELVIKEEMEKVLTKSYEQEFENVETARRKVEQVCMEFNKVAYQLNINKQLNAYSHPRELLEMWQTEIHPYIKSLNNTQQKQIQEKLQAKEVLKKRIDEMNIRKGATEIKIVKAEKAVKELDNKIKKEEAKKEECLGELTGEAKTRKLTLTEKMEKLEKLKEESKKAKEIIKQLEERVEKDTEGLKELEESLKKLVKDNKELAEKAKRNKRLEIMKALDEDMQALKLYQQSAESRK